MPAHASPLLYDLGNTSTRYLTANFVPSVFEIDFGKINHRVKKYFRTPSREFLLLLGKQIGYNGTGLIIKLIPRRYIDETPDFRVSRRVGVPTPSSPCDRLLFTLITRSHFHNNIIYYKVGPVV